MSANNRVLRAAEAIRALYEVHIVGGGLHIVVDDYNLEDEHLDFCETSGDGAGEGGQLDALERSCLDALRPLSVEDRAAALALYEDGIGR